MQTTRIFQVEDLGIYVHVSVHECLQSILSANYFSILLTAGMYIQFAHEPISSQFQLPALQWMLTLSLLHLQIKGSSLLRTSRNISSAAAADASESRCDRPKPDGL